MDMIDATSKFKQSVISTSYYLVAGWTLRAQVLRKLLVRIVKWSISESLPNARLREEDDGLLESFRLFIA